MTLPYAPGTQVQPILEQDQLTGAFDRASFDRMIEYVVAQALQRSGMLSIILFDIDYFKSINDSYGHRRGDEVLHHLAQRVLGLIRSGDLLFRYGGDEFILLLTAMMPSHANALAHRLLEEICSAPLPGEPALTVSMSIGIAHFPNDGTTSHELFEAADRRAYSAKRHGRSQVVVDDSAENTAQFTIGERLIERDNAVAQLRHWINGIAMGTVPVLRVEGWHGAGRSSMLRYLQQAAALRGIPCLFLTGSRQSSIRPLGSITTAEWPDPLPIAGSPSYIAEALRDSSRHRGAQSFLIAADTPQLLDRTTRSLITELIAHSGTPAAALAFASEPSLTAPFDLGSTPTKILALAPLTHAGLLVWLRQALRLEPPAHLLQWFEQTTGGIPGRFKPVLDALVVQHILRSRPGGWELDDDTSQLPELTAQSTELQPNIRGVSAALTDFVGREVEAEQIIVRLDSCRLLTMVGPGGIGKTRLAAHVATLLADEYRDGAVFISLAALADSQFVAPTIGAALGIRDDGSQLLADRLQSELADKKMLLILDNFEHVLDAAPLLTDLLGAAPELKVLVTSREMLDIYGEHLYQVPPLAVPDTSQSLALEQLAQFTAVSLFVSRAQAVNELFVLDQSNATAVAELCAKLDGLPLAIELAAARCYNHDPQELVELLGSRLALLAHGPRDRSSRQRTLRGAIDWSYQLLSKDQQQLFRQMSIYAGGCDIQAVIAMATPITSWPEPPLLDSLVDKSLLNRIQLDTPKEQLYSRYIMLETIREYALERLRLEGEEESLRQAHLAYFTELAEECNALLTGERQEETIARIESEHDNLRAALRWAFDRRDALGAGRLAGALARFWWMRTYLNEGRQWLEEALALFNLEPAIPRHAETQRVRALALLGYGTLIWRQGDYSEARVPLEESVQIARALGDPLLLSYTLNQAGLAYRGEGNFAQAERYFSESLALREQQGHRRGVAIALGNLGVAIFQQGRAGEARPYAERSLAILRDLQDAWGVAMAIYDLIDILIAQQEYDEVRSLIEELIPLAQVLGDRALLAWALTALGEIDFQTGGHDHGYSSFLEGLTHARAVGDKDAIACALLSLARHEIAQGRPQCAATLLGMKSIVRQQIRAPRSIWEERRYRETLAVLQAALSPDVIQRHWAEGAAHPDTDPECLHRS